MESEIEGSTLREINGREIKNAVGHYFKISNYHSEGKAVRENLKLSVRDSLEWKVEKGKVVVSPAQKKF